MQTMICASTSSSFNSFAIVSHSIMDRVFFFRFDELKELSSNRQSQLEDSLGLHQFFYDIEMEMAWIREHMTLATSEDLGTSLIGVQRLQKRHLVNKNVFFSNKFDIS